MKEEIELANTCLSQNSPTSIVKSRFARPSNKVAPDIVVADIEDSYSPKIDEKMNVGGYDNILYVIQKKKPRNSRRSSYLMDLRKSVEEGNSLSTKIWNQLDDKTKK